MKLNVRALTFLLSVLAESWLALPATAQNQPKTEPKSHGVYPALPSEIPAKFKPTNDSFDYVKRDVMIPMRDGVKLHTVILIPKGAKEAPILLTRTPYDADKLTSHADSAHLGPVLNGYDNAARCDPGGRLHPRRAGRPRQARLRGGLRRQSSLARPAEHDAGRSCDRYVRHHRLAREERPGDATARSASWGSRTTASFP